MRKALQGRRGDFRCVQEPRVGLRELVMQREACVGSTLGGTITSTCCPPDTDGWNPCLRTVSGLLVALWMAVFLKHKEEWAESPPMHAFVWASLAMLAGPALVLLLGLQSHSR